MCTGRGAAGALRGQQLLIEPFCAQVPARPALPAAWEPLRHTGQATTLLHRASAARPPLLLPVAIVALGCPLEDRLRAEPLLLLSFVQDVVSSLPVPHTLHPSQREAGKSGSPAAAS